MVRAIRRLLPIIRGLVAAFGAKWASPMWAHLVLSLVRDRQNTRAAARYRPGSVFNGHYDITLMEEIRDSAAAVGVLEYVTLPDSSLFKKTNETSCFIPLRRDGILTDEVVTEDDVDKKPWRNICKQLLAVLQQQKVSVLPVCERVEKAWVRDNVTRFLKNAGKGTKLGNIDVLKMTNEINLMATGNNGYWRKLPELLIKYLKNHYINARNRDTTMNLIEVDRIPVPASTEASRQRSARLTAVAVPITTTGNPDDPVLPPIVEGAAIAIALRPSIPAQPVDDLLNPDPDRWRRTGKQPPRICSFCIGLAISDAFREACPGAGNRMLCWSVLGTRRKSPKRCATCKHAFCKGRGPMTACEYFEPV